MSSSDEESSTFPAPAISDAVAANSPDRVTMIHKPRKQNLDSRDLPGHHEPSNMEQVPDHCLAPLMTCIIRYSSVLLASFYEVHCEDGNIYFVLKHIKRQPYSQLIATTQVSKAELQHIMMCLLCLKQPDLIACDSKCAVPYQMIVPFVSTSFPSLFAVCTMGAACSSCSPYSVVIWTPFRLQT